ncbi:MAG: His-Xaa-Ser system radical SAM maturase HxsC [Magnetococcales bacterium]|nr:His-Xaa-Ser system radical SAM maturase HxsC [Magnetococcales bacterium]
MIRHSFQIREHDAAREPVVFALKEMTFTAGGLRIGSPYGDVVLAAMAGELDRGDILALFPEENRVVRWFFSDSLSHTLLLTEACDQRCLMCSQPPRPHRYPFWKLYAQALNLLPEGSQVGLSGGEPLLLKKELVPWLLEMHRCRPDLTFHLLSNAQHLKLGDRDWIEPLREVLLWGIPLYAGDAERHDQIVFKKGAFETLLSGLNLLARCGSRVELRSIVMQPTWTGLSALADFVTRHLRFIDYWALMQLEPMGYAGEAWEGLFVDTSEHFAPVATALAMAQAVDVATLLYNFPRCTVPEPWRDRVCASVSDWKRRYLPQCGLCREQSVCGGFFESYWDRSHQGFQRIQPL